MFVCLWVAVLQLWSTEILWGFPSTLVQHERVSERFYILWTFLFADLCPELVDEWPVCELTEDYFPSVCVALHLDSGLDQLKPVKHFVG